MIASARRNSFSAARQSSAVGSLIPSSRSNFLNSLAWHSRSILPGASIFLPSSDFRQRGLNPYFSASSDHVILGLDFFSSCAARTWTRHCAGRPRRFSTYRRRILCRSPIICPVRSTIGSVCSRSFASGFGNPYSWSFPIRFSIAFRSLESQAMHRLALSVLRNAE